MKCSLNLVRAKAQWMQFLLYVRSKKSSLENKELWIAFVDLEKAFDRVPRDVLWWALRRVGVEEWLIKVIKSIYEGCTTSVRMNGEESENFEVKVGVHQGSVLSPILFNIVMQAIAENFKKGLP